MENENMHRIQRVSGIFIVLFTVFIIGIPVFTLLYWLFFNSLPAGFTTELPVSAKQTLPPATMTLAFLVSLIPASVAIYGLSTLKKLFQLYTKAIVFSEKNADCFRRLGYTLIAWVFANMIFTTLISIVISYGNPPGERMMVVGFGTSEISTLIIGAIVVLVSWVMNEATKLEDEQAYTV